MKRLFFTLTVLFFSFPNNSFGQCADTKIEISHPGCLYDNGGVVFLGAMPVTFKFSFQAGDTTSRRNSFGLLAFQSTFDSIYTELVDNNGCRDTLKFYKSDLMPYDPVIVTKDSDTLSCLKSQVSFDLRTSGGTPPYEYTLFPGGNTFTDPTVVVDTKGLYSITAVDAIGCEGQGGFRVGWASFGCSKIEGNVLIDSDNDCQNSLGDYPFLNDVTITAEGKLNTFTQKVNLDGSYSIVSAPDTFDITVNVPTGPKCFNCLPSQQVILGNTTISDVDFIFQKNCTSDAGFLPGDSIKTCDAFVDLPIPQNMTLDSNDVMRYILFTNPNDPLGSRIRLQGSFITKVSLPGLPSVFYVSALVGDNIPGVDLDVNDPCISISNSIKIIHDYFTVEVAPHCLGDSVKIIFNDTPPITGWLLPINSSDTIHINTDSLCLNLDPNILAFTYNLTSGNGCQTSGLEVAVTNRRGCEPWFTDTITCLNPILKLRANCDPQILNWSWEGPSGFTSSERNPQILNPDASNAGTYRLTVVDAHCTIVTEVTVPYKDDGCGNIHGNVLLDAESDCQITSTDTPLDCWVVAAYGKQDTFYGTTDPLGNYSINVLPDTFDVQVVLRSSYFSNCNLSQEIIIANPDDTRTADFLVKKEIDCPLMEIDVSVNRLRRCFDNNMYVRYCNQGTDTAFDASIKIKLDPLMSPTTSAMPFTLNGDTLIFEIGDVAPLECSNFRFKFRVSCDAVLGQTLCAEARIFPDSLCTVPSLLWSRASLNLFAECVGDSIHFSVKNVGTGTMDIARQYIIIEDAAIMRVSNPFQLSPDSTINDVVFADGSTIRVEVPQVDNHPGNSMPSVTVEGCGSSNFSIGFVNQLPTDDADPWIDIECAEVTGSYDPNDKAAAPTGFESAHFIDQNIDLEYKIRFQNTGTDTAFTVVILDTLSHLLDIEKLTPGASSHDYRWEVFEDGILKFTFENILLVDSFTNEPASNGFVKYRIAQKPDVALESVIKNAADIYFDFNDPIYTNQTFHTVGKDFISVSTQEVFVPGAEIRVYPNPFRTEAQIKILNAPLGEKTLRIFDLSGKMIRSQVFDNEQLTLKRNALPSGIYFYEISGEGAKIAVGKLLIQ